MKNVKIQAVAKLIVKSIAVSVRPIVEAVIASVIVIMFFSNMAPQSADLPPPEVVAVIEG